MKNNTISKEYCKEWLDLEKAKISDRLSSLHYLFNFIFVTILWGGYYLLSVSLMEKHDLEEFNSFLRVMDLLCAIARAEIQVCLMP